MRLRRNAYESSCYRRSRYESGSGSGFVVNRSPGYAFNGGTGGSGEPTSISKRESPMKSVGQHHFGDQEAQRGAAGIGLPEHPAFERHYRVGELAEMW